MFALPVIAGFAIGAVFGVVGLLSGFCLMSSLRDWWTHDDGRKIRSYALAVAVAVVGTQFMAGAGIVEIAKSLYLQRSFSAPLIFVGGSLFGLGMVLSNGCASRALVLLGKGNLRSLVVIAIIGVTAQMTLKGLLAPMRLAILQWTQMTPGVNSLPSLFGTLGIPEATARVAATLIVAGGLLVFALSHRALRRSPGQLAAGLVMGLLVIAGWLATGWLGADEFDPIPVASLTFVSPAADTLQFIMLSTGMTLNFGIALVAGVFIGSLFTALADRALRVRGLHIGAPHRPLDGWRRADGDRWRDGLWLFDRAGAHGCVHAGAAIFRCCRGYPCRRGHRDPRFGTASGFCGAIIPPRRASLV